MFIFRIHNLLILKFDPIFSKVFLDVMGHKISITYIKPEQFQINFMRPKLEVKHTSLSSELEWNAYDL